jgi:hypothetical protein
MKRDRQIADCEVAGQAAPLLNAAVKVARTAYTDQQILDCVNRALEEAAAMDLAEQSGWDTSWPTLF